ncbi:thiamine diphosphokinase [Stappia sp. ES.058]|uniref:thiamine diphosphokinase n=1 Tax=Stappia sp. ES.058 TaxID=1881061 RepID=UPI00087D5AA1|nr:thiamine diphosphokinase [Stappia sp. ES.058]SDT89522.1 thiamine pyrophosphokinase [Stappia sp. ES.058]
MKDGTSFLILLGGEVVATPRLIAQIADHRAIAADGGMRHAAPLGVTPELWVGDFDSSDDALARDWADVRRQSYPEDKDMTDGELAVAEALARGADALVIAGALGGARSDHAVHNLLHGISLHAGGLPVMMTSGTEEAWPLMPGDQTVDLPAGTLFSVLAFSDLCALSLGGVDWPLTDRDVTMGQSLTLSNRVASGNDGGVRVSLRSGTAVLLARPGADGDVAGA